jgi:SEC-C motif
VSIVDEWRCGYVKGIALDPSGWQRSLKRHPDWFEAIHLYGTESGWDRLKELVEAYQDADARHQAFVELLAPAARNVHAYWLARRAPARDTIEDTRRPIHKVLVPGRNDPCLCGSGKKFKHCHIVALTCDTQNCLQPPSSLLKRPRQACCATPVQDQKCWNTAAFEQSQFIDHTGGSAPGARSVFSRDTQTARSGR